LGKDVLTFDADKKGMREGEEITVVYSTL